MNLSRFPHPSHWPAAYGWMLYAVQQLEKSKKPATEDSLLALLHQSGDSQAMAIEAAVTRIVLNNLVKNGVLHTSTIAEQTAFLCSRAVPTVELHEVGRNHGQTPYRFTAAYLQRHIRLKRSARTVNFGVRIKRLTRNGRNKTPRLHIG